jgi:hypothetical protein
MVHGSILMENKNSTNKKGERYREMTVPEPLKMVGPELLHKAPVIIRPIKLA